MNKIIKISLWFLSITALIVSLAFVGDARRSQLCSGVIISIDSTSHNEFITEDSIRSFLVENFDSLENRPLATIDLNKIEYALQKNQFIKKVDVYETINGKIGINIIQRVPSIRVIGFGEKSFYYDEDGQYMPLSNTYSAHVPLIMCDSLWHNSIIPKSVRLSKKDTLETATPLAQLFVLANFVKSDTLLNAIVDHIFLKNDKEFIIIPRMHSHIIEFGDISDYEEKFDKLILFYQKGLNAVGWDTYSSINLKFKNQVVCKQNKNGSSESQKVAVSDSTEKKQ